MSGFARNFLHTDGQKVILCERRRLKTVRHEAESVWSWVGTFAAMDAIISSKDPFLRRLIVLTQIRLNHANAM